MSTAAVTMVKDEADIIGTTVRHMLTQVDYVIVSDNMSTDTTPDILLRLASDFPKRLVLERDDEVGYHQSRKMTRLAHRAHDLWNVDWVVPFDADEIWYSPFHHRLADHLDDVAGQWLVMPATVYDHVATRVDDESIVDPTERIGYRRMEPLPLNKVACQWRHDLTIEMGNHGARYHGGATIHEPQLVVRHFPYRSVDQLIRKVENGAAAYKATNLDESYGAHWRQWGQLLEQSGPQAIDDLFHEWYYDRYPNRIDTDKIFDPAPVRS